MQVELWWYTTKRYLVNLVQCFTSVLCRCHFEMWVLSVSRAAESLTRMDRVNRSTDRTGLVAPRTGLAFPQPDRVVSQIRAGLAAQMA